MKKFKEIILEAETSDEEKHKSHIDKELKKIIGILNKVYKKKSYSGNLKTVGRVNRLINYAIEFKNTK